MLDLYEKDILHALKPELALSLLNYIRDQSVNILNESLALNQTPHKSVINHPGKYDYESPVKSVAKKTEASNERRKDLKPEKLSFEDLSDFEDIERLGGKSSKDTDEVKEQDKFTEAERRSFSPGKRAQLFRADNGKTEDEHNFGVKPLENVEIDDDFLMRTVEASRGQSSKKPVQIISDSESQRANESKRGKSDELIKNESENEAPNTKPKYEKRGARRSLDSCLEKSQGNQRQSRTRTSKNATLADYIAVSDKSSNGKKKNKKKRRSEGHVISPSPSEDRSASPDFQRSIKRSTSSKSNGSNMNFASRASVPPNTQKVYPKEKSEKELKKPIVKPEMAKPDFINEEPKKQYIEPDPYLVTCRSQLDKLAGLYSYCIDNLLIPNITAEMYIVLELLTVKKAINNDAIERSYLDSVHNCVYFASRIIDDQCDNWLFGLDRVTIRYLMENPRLDLFRPGLHRKIEDIAGLNEQYLRTCRGTSALGMPPSILSSFEVRKNDYELQSIGFHPETDNRENFPDAQTFQDFRKQRDAFYDILRGWRNVLIFGEKPVNHCKYNNSVRRKNGKQQVKPGSLLEEYYGEEIRNLISLQMNPINMAHLALLFQEQLLAMCINDITNNSDDDDLARELAMPKVEADKLKRLITRCLTPSNHGGPCPEPTFSGPQEFFRDFIKIAGGNHAFISHLQNTLMATISELNDKYFEVATEDLHNTENKLPQTDDSILILSILKLRVLGKFLGYVETLPYQSDVPIAGEKMVLAQIRVRKKYVPCLDVHKLLKEAFSKKRLIMTLPWVVEFCSVQDAITMQLPYYKRLFALMVKIYKTFKTESDKCEPRKSGSTSSDFEEFAMMFHAGAKPKVEEIKITRFNSFFLCVNLGWMFENSNFPRELFITGPEFPSKERSNSGGMEIHKGECIDGIFNLRPSLLYVCCPYLSELKVVMSQFHTGLKAPKLAKIGGISSNEKVYVNGDKESVIKFRETESKTRRVALKNNHLKKFSHQISESQDSDDEGQWRRHKRVLSVKEAQETLETNFVFVQKSSTKITMEFVTERVTANVIRAITEKCINAELAVVRQNLEEILSLFGGEKHRQIYTIERKSQIEYFAEKAYYKSLDEALKLLKNEAGLKCEQGLLTLLPSDVRFLTANMCVAICVTKVVSHVKEWMKGHHTIEFFRRQLESVGQVPTKCSGAMLLLKHVDTDKLAEVPTTDLKEESSTWALIRSLKCLAYIIAAEELDKDSNSFKTVEMKTMRLLEKIGVAVGNDVTTIKEEQIYRRAANAEEADAMPISELDATLKGIESATADLAVILCANAPDAMTPKLQEEFIHFWAGPQKDTKIVPLQRAPLSGPPPEVATLLSLRNVQVLAKSPSPHKTWNVMENFLGRLIRCGLMPPLVFEGGCVQLLRMEWSPNILQRLGSCFKGVADSLIKQNLSDCEFNQDFIDWMAWFLIEVSQDELSDNLENFPELNFEW